MRKYPVQTVFWQSKKFKGFAASLFLIEAASFIYGFYEYRKLNRSRVYYRTVEYFDPSCTIRQEDKEAWQAENRI
ncbi:hypothetical protein Anas_06919 [Armadillidium nasatum]|uniref:Uncharacterized protein n=1 Tax=Armadillidium nasatum TaxID=96803 RepID=A0A5N5SND6_9CRUS|nr:hypothetical protein Anas_06919 [Armadillidium nasatum]